MLVRRVAFCVTLGAGEGLVVNDFTILRDNEVAEIVEVYVAHRLMPKDPFCDAMHLALASFHKCDFLLTWNCQNLANANKFGHIRRVHAILGLHVPTLATPLELMEDAPDETG